MKLFGWLLAILAGLMLPSCGGGSSGSSGGFQLIEFLVSGQDNIPRNRQLQFRFSSPIEPTQDLFTRLKVQNVIQTQPSNFARASGFYLVSGELVTFCPRLPNKPDRSDAGFKSDGNYHVFLNGGPDGLQSTSGETIATQQEFIFETNEYFEDAIPAQPPRALQLVAIDPTDGSLTDLSRLDPRPLHQAMIDNATLIEEGCIIDPGAGGPPNYATPWHIELRISESLDPATVTGNTVELYEIRENAINTPPNQADPNHFGDTVSFRVPVQVSTVQSVDEDGNFDIRIRATPLQTLVDNTRYRILFSGDVLGIDFRKTFSGDNGLTGDGDSMVDGSVYPESGGLGYVSEFIVSDRDVIQASRMVLYDPVQDGIDPELGQTTLDPDKESNSALYNPAESPGTAVGFLSAFGQGTDGDLAVSGGNTVILDTGDTLNEPLGEEFTVNDLNPDDDYLTDTRPGGPMTYDSVEPFELELSSLTISGSSILRVQGVNPVTFRVTGLVTINGTLDISGEAGRAAGSSTAEGGAAGAGGFRGATSKRGASNNCLPQISGTCSKFSQYLNSCAASKGTFPSAVNGYGPGRGLAGGELFSYPYDQKNVIGSSGGGGGSHARQGTRGEDRKNAARPAGDQGICDSQYTYNRVSLSSVVGVRSMPGPTYGDRVIETNTMGGSGGGAAGAHYQYSYPTASSGGAGGGGGGSLTIVCAGNLDVHGTVDASGGAGGKGRIFSPYPSQAWDRVPGGGGGGAGGSIALISGADINLAGALITAAGGIGGARGNVGTSKSSSAANAGGDGGDGFIFLMDADGEIDGFAPGGTGEYAEYDNDARGVLTISPFNANRFSSITAVTELFPMTAAKPTYVNFGALTDIKGVVSADQTITILVSSAKGSSEDPLRPDLTTEQVPFPVALLEYKSGATKVSFGPGDMSELNATPGTSKREAFVRVQAAFYYKRSVEAALGPFASIDEVKITYDFNG